MEDFSTWIKKWSVLVVAGILLTAGIGCAALSQIITPAEVSKAAVKYVTEAGVADPNSYSGFANLEKAIRLQTDVDAAYQVKTLALKQMMEKNELDYSQLRGVVATNAELAVQREQQMFGEKGLLSMGLSLMGMGGLTGMIGLMRKRPGDITPQEMESAVAELKGEVSDKDRQLIEIVKGIQVYLDAHPKGDPAGDELRAQLQKQSIDTRLAVAQAKASA